MKTLLAALSLIIAFTAAAHADTIQVDDIFTKTQKWLDEKNLTVTGGPNGARDDEAAFSQEALMFYGEAVGNPDHRTPAQREQMAKRAAVVTAQRALAEYLEGFALVGDTLVKDGMGQYDVIRSAVSGFVKGSQVVFQEYSKEKDTALAMVKLGLHGPRGFASAIYEKMFSDPKAKESLKTDNPAFKTHSVQLDEAYDGLIIDATEQNFRPALINRIFATKGDVLYDPAKISQKVLVEQGCGEYTNSLDKAKTSLATRGVRNPLVVKASGATSAADLQVTDDDAVTIYSANKKSDFLSAAKVAFVLK
uniref:Lipoprotein n=1 Tax=Geobacter sp. (strain M21) TaxID=443144 RepID=C6DZB7_GEOSM